MDMRNRKKTQGGFTLIELVSVVIILGILAAVIVPKYFDMTSKAKDAAYKGALNEGVARFNIAYSQYIVTNRAKPSGLTILGDSAYLGSNLASVSIGDYSVAYTGTDPIVITLSDSAGSALTFANGNAATASVSWPN